MEIIAGAGVFVPGEVNYVPQFASHELSVGTYSLPAGGFDDQSPHNEDEIYVVQSGRATVVTPSGTADVGPGAVIYVPAGEEHQFTSITEDLALLVFFAPPYGSRSPALRGRKSVTFDSFSSAWHGSSVRVR
jgi:mannose-6-phosphate isomerase-like protein (cupin superfamily)